MESFFKAEFENPFYKEKNIKSNISSTQFDEEETENFLVRREIKPRKLNHSSSKKMPDSHLSSPFFIDSDSSPVTRYAHHLFNVQNS